MKEWIKKILQGWDIYHPLQSFYRTSILTIQKLVYRTLYIKYKGKGFTCNVCRYVYEKFVSDMPDKLNRDAITKYKVIAGYGKNIICPNCLSTARERLVLAFLYETELENKKVLHFSPEKNIYNYLKRHAIVTTADLFPRFYKTIDKKISKVDATSIDFDDEQFDIVIACHIMEHIPDDKAAMQEIYRILKCGGKAILQVPYSENLLYTVETPGINEPELQQKLYGQKDHVRIYALHDYVDRLKFTGFEVQIVSYPELKHLYNNAIQKKECFLKISKPMT